jgi:hypothetical protein
LFAVTTGLPARAARARDRPPARARPSPRRRRRSPGRRGSRRKSVVVGTSPSRSSPRRDEALGRRAAGARSRARCPAAWSRRQPVDGGADRPVAEQGNRNVDRRHCSTVPQRSRRAPPQRAQPPVKTSWPCLRRTDLPARPVAERRLRP